MMSAAAAMAGFFPPSKDEIWNADLLWQPIPINMIPQNLDYVLRGGAPCDRYFQEFQSLWNSTEYKAKLESYGDLFKYLEEHSGLQIKTFTDVGLLYDTLLVEHSRNLT